MKKMNQIMQEIGFKKDSPDSIKEAFIKHLIHQTTGQVVETPTEKINKIKSLNKPSTMGHQSATHGETFLRTRPAEQLSFNFDSQESSTAVTKENDDKSPSDKKVS